MRKQGLAAATRARAELRSIDLDELEAERHRQVTRAIEAIDELLLTASLGELAALGRALAEDEMVVDLAEENGQEEALR